MDKPLNLIHTISCSIMSALRLLLTGLPLVKNGRLFYCTLVFAAAGICLAENQGDAAALDKETSLPNPAVVGKEDISGAQAEVELGESVLTTNPRLAEFLSLIKKTNMVHIFKKGGPIMWPLLLASILALATVLERVFFLTIEWCKRDRKAIQKVFDAVQKSDVEQAIQISEKSNFYVVRVLGYALAHRGKSLTNAMLYAQEEELKRFRRGIPMLDTIITLAPLLGLLGTVTGMMGSFSLIGGELSAPGAITGGIAEALIATAFGLGIAITSLIPFNFLNTKLEEAGLQIESAGMQLELLMKSQMNKASSVDSVKS